MVSLMGKYFTAKPDEIAVPKSLNFLDDVEVTTSTPIGDQVTFIKKWSHDPYQKRYWRGFHTESSIEPGIYVPKYEDGVGVFLQHKEPYNDELYDLDHESITAVIDEIVQFTELKEEFVKRQYLFKRGILLWGPPGSGKTSLLNLVCDMFIEKHDGVIIYGNCEPDNLVSSIQMIREIEEERQLVVVLEDMDDLVNRHEEFYLNLLDGQLQTDNIIFLATTNYPERLDQRFVNRPSRFDTIQYIGMPSKKARISYIEAKEPDLRKNDPELFEDLVAGTENMSISHLKEAIIQVMCFKKPIEKVIENMRRFNDIKINSEDSPDKPSFGFT